MSGYEKQNHACFNKKVTVAENSGDEIERQK